MSFQEDGVYYIRGIVSLTASRGESALCDIKQYVIFTDVAQYLPWIEEVVPDLKRSESGNYTISINLEIYQAVQPIKA